jgi:hypothetical protein
MDPNCNHKTKRFLGPRACSHGISYGIFPKDFGQIVLLSSPLPPRCHIFLAIETWPGQPKIKCLIGPRSQDCSYNRESLQQQQQKQEQERTSDVRMVCSCLFLGLQHWYTLILYVSWIQIEKLSSHQPRQPSWINHEPVGSQCWGRPPTSSVWLVSVTCLYPTYLSNLSLSIVYLYQTNLYPACLYQILSQT